MSKDLSIQVKQTIVRLQKQSKSIWKIEGTFGVAKSTVWYILRKKEHTGELSNIKRPGRPRRTTVMDDRRILSMIKKNPFTTSSQEKNTLQEADVSLSKSTIKRRLHQSKNRGFTTSCKQGQIRLCQKHLKKPDHFWKSILWTAEIKINLYQNDGKKKSGEGLEQLMIRSIQHHLWNMEQCDAWAAWLPEALGYWCLVMMRQKTEAAGYRDILSAQNQQNGAKLIGLRFIIQMDNDPKHTAQTTQEFLKVKKWIILQWPSQSPDFIPIELHFTCWRQN